MRPLKCEFSNFFSVDLTSSGIFFLRWSVTCFWEPPGPKYIHQGSMKSLEE